MEDDLELLRRLYGGGGRDEPLLMLWRVALARQRGKRPARLTQERLARALQGALSAGDRLHLPHNAEGAYELARRLASRELRQLRGRPRGRPRRWGIIELALLAGEVQHELEVGAVLKTGAHNLTQACRRLAATPWWDAWLGSPLPPHGCDTLRKTYQGMDQRARRLGENAYSGAKTHPRTQQEWVHLVITHLLPLPH